MGGVLFWDFFCFRAPGGKKARQEATATKDSKEGRKEGRKEVRKEGSTEGAQEGRKEGGRAGRKEGRDRIVVHICAGNTGSNGIFFLNPEPKPYGPKALNHLTP